MGKAVLTILAHTMPGKGVVGRIKLPTHLCGRKRSADDVRDPMSLPPNHSQVLLCRAWHRWLVAAAPFFFCARVCDGEHLLPIHIVELAMPHHEARHSVYAAAPVHAKANAIGPPKWPGNGALNPPKSIHIAEK